MAPPETFTLFAQLPAELRIKIWHHALPLFPRVFELKPVRWNDTTFPDTLPSDFRTAPKWTLGISAIPPLLSVSSEARSELLPFYDVRVTDKGVAASAKCGAPSEVPLCPETDMLHVNVRKSQKVYDGTRALLEEVFGERGPEVARRLRRMAGSERFWACLRGEGMDGGLGALEALEEAILVVPSRTMRIVGELDVCGAAARAGAVLARENIARSKDGNRAGDWWDMRMCAAGDLGRAGKGHQVECDFMSSGSDIFIFT